MDTLEDTTSRRRQDSDVYHRFKLVRPLHDSTGTVHWILNGVSANSWFSQCGITEKTDTNSAPYGPITDEIKTCLQERAQSAGAFLGRRHYDVNKQEIKTDEVLHGHNIYSKYVDENPKNINKSVAESKMGECLEVPHTSFSGRYCGKYVHNNPIENKTRLLLQRPHTSYCVRPNVQIDTTNIRPYIESLKISEKEPSQKTKTKCFLCEQEDMKFGFNREPRSQTSADNREPRSRTSADNRKPRSQTSADNREPRSQTYVDNQEFQLQTSVENREPRLQTSDDSRKPRSQSSADHQEPPAGENREPRSHSPANNNVPRSQTPNGNQDPRSQMSADNVGFHENVETVTRKLQKRIQSAPPLFYQSIHNSSIKKPDTPTVPLYWRTRSDYHRKQRGDEFQSYSENNSLPLTPKGSLLKPLLHQEGSEMKHSSGCPYKCKGCFRACLASQDYLDNLTKWKLQKAKKIQSKPKFYHRRIVEIALARHQPIHRFINNQKLDK